MNVLSMCSSVRTSGASVCTSVCNDLITEEIIAA